MFDLALGAVEKCYRGMSQGIGVLLVLKGKAFLELNGFRHVLEADDVVVVNSKDIYSLDANSSNIVLVLRIYASFLERECPEILSWRYDCNSAALGETPLEKMNFFNMKRSLIRMMLANYKREDGFSLEVKRALLDLLYDLYKNFRTAAPESGRAEATPREIESIRRALTYIHENYRGDIGLAKVAASVGMSPQYFSRRFKQKRGVGFLEYLNRVRLDSAVRELLQTNESILRVAVNNGFAGSKPFTALFKKVYGQTPRSYKLGKSERRGTAGVRRDEIPEEDAIFGIKGEGLDDLLRYVAFYDIRHGYRLDSAESISVALCPETAGKIAPKAGKAFSMPGKIFKIGRLSEALDDRLRDQLALAQKKLHGEYIYFQGIFDDGILPCVEDSYFERYDHERLFEFFRELGLTPFVRVDLSRAPEAWESAVSAFMRALAENRPVSYRGEGVRFEIVHSRPMVAKEFAARFREIGKLLKTFAPAAGVGFDFVSCGGNDDQWPALSEKLSACREAGCFPDFLSLTLDPATESEYPGFDGSFYGSFRNYGLSRIEQVERLWGEYCAAPPELYVTEWNTLSGRSRIESSTFFRAALIAAELAAYGERVSGVAYWLNSKSKELLTGVMDNRVLALFFYGRVKRPPYHLLYLVNKLSGDLLYRDDRLVVTAAQSGEYAVMAINPCYFDPLYSVEEAYGAMESIRLEVRLTGVPKGRYRFKSFIFDKRHSSVFDRLSKVGYPSLNDEDVTDYLEHAVLPEFNAFEDDIDEVYILNPDLGYNAVALYLLRRIG